MAAFSSILAIHSITYRYNHVKVIEWYIANYLSATLKTNLCIFCTG